MANEKKDEKLVLKRRPRKRSLSSVSSSSSASDSLKVALKRRRARRDSEQNTKNSQLELVGIAHDKHKARLSLSSNTNRSDNKNEKPIKCKLIFCLIYLAANGHVVVCKGVSVPHQAEREELEDLFYEQGKVKRIDMKFKDSKIYFVTYEDELGAMRAIKNLNNKHIRNQVLTVGWVYTKRAE